MLLLLKVLFVFRSSLYSTLKRRRLDDRLWTIWLEFVCKRSSHQHHSQDTGRTTVWIADGYYWGNVFGNQKAAQGAAF